MMPAVNKIRSPRKKDVESSLKKDALISALSLSFNAIIKRVTQTAGIIKSAVSLVATPSPTQTPTSIAFFNETFFVNSFRL